ncbi:MAG: glycosyltransferase family 4 protein [Rhodospirillales bacterium]|nr:glycosyltransferase family 4 protein [Rhodospirillales bacterium]MDE2576484.1 glycosyltransferase family 4 protein [Rhodospirillales bacterium]
MSAVAINARFLAQNLTGVQRFAIEMTQALLAAWPEGREAPALLAPAGAPARPGLAPTRIGRLRGHAWEQISLPRHGGGVLVNLGNTAPLAWRRQLVVIHDAGAFATPDAYSWKFRLWYRLLQRGLARRRVGLATVSLFSRNEIARSLGVDPRGIAVLSEGAEHILRAPADWRVAADHGLEAGRYVLVVGSLAPHKNLAALGPTAAMLAARGMTLAITGGFNESVFATSALPRPATLLGRVSDAALRGLYERAACFLFPSRYEGFGLPAIEAMACGCPVVAARAGALPEVCGDAAVFCDPAAPGDIAGAVAALLDDAPMAAELVRRGRLRAAAATWPRAAGLLYDAIIDAESATPGSAA